MPRTASGLPSTITNGGSPASTRAAMPVIACAPMRTNWCTPVKPPRIDPVADVHVAGELRVVGEDGVVADLAVVREVHVGHDPVVVADAGDAAVLRACRC